MKNTSSEMSAYHHNKYFRIAIRFTIHVSILHFSIGDARKYPYLYHGWLLGFPTPRGFFELI